MVEARGESTLSSTARSKDAAACDVLDNASFTPGGLDVGRKERTLVAGSLCSSDTAVACTERVADESLLAKLSHTAFIFASPSFFDADAAAAAADDDDDDDDDDGAAATASIVLLLCEELASSSISEYSASPNPMDRLFASSSSDMLDSMGLKR